MVNAKVVLRNPLGLHLRPAGVLCTEALKYTSNVQIKKGSAVTNAKSVLGVLATGIRFGDEFEIICTGEDEERALKELTRLIEEGIGEKL